MSPPVAIPQLFAHGHCVVVVMMMVMVILAPFSRRNNHGLWCCRSCLKESCHWGEWRWWRWWWTCPFVDVAHSSTTAITTRCQSRPLSTRTATRLLQINFISLRFNSIYKFRSVIQSIKNNNNNKMLQGNWIEKPLPHPFQSCIDP